MKQHLDRELETLRKRIAQMGRIVSEQLDTALAALLNSDREKSLQVVSGDDKADELEVSIEEECLKVIALHQPVARDLRFLITVLKVNNDLERIADHAVNIAQIAKKFSEKHITDSPPQIVKMARLVTEACHACIDAFVKEDVDAAMAICQDDKTVNQLCGLVYDEAKRIQTEGRGTFGHAIRIYRVGRELERVGDLLKNVAEDTIYLSTGRVVRHRRFERLDIEASGLEG